MARRQSVAPPTNTAGSAEAAVAVDDEQDGELHSDDDGERGGEWVGEASFVGVDGRGRGGRHERGQGSREGGKAMAGGGHAAEDRGEHCEGGPESCRVVGCAGAR